MIKEIPQKLPVTGVMQEQKRFIVERDGKEYLVKQLQFQYGKDKPETLPCIIKLDDNNEVREIKQDYRPYLETFYKRGNIYTFIVKADRMQTGNYYEVNDTLGFFSRVYNVRSVKLKVGQKIKCMITGILGCILKLIFVEVQPEEELLNNLRNDLKEKAVNSIRKGDEFIELLLNDSANNSFEVQIDEWLMQYTLQATTDQASKEEGTDEVKQPISSNQQTEQLENIKAFCLYVLEETDMLRKLMPTDMKFVQRHFSVAIEHIEVMMQAVRAISHDEQESVVTQTFSRLSTSGFLYDAEKKLLLTDFVLTLCPKLFESQIEQLFAVITLEANTEMRETMPYVTMFVRMLEHYIMQCRLITDNVDSMEGNDDLQDRVTSVIKALAIQQLLADKCKDLPFDVNINRARLYRYLTYLNGCNIPRCFEKAYYCLMGEHVPQLEFAWRDVQAPLLIMMRVCEHGMAGELATTRHFVTNKVDLKLSDTISLSPCHALPMCKNQLPADLLPWHHVEVCLNDAVHFSQVADKDSMRPYEELWRNLERHLFAAEEVVRGLPSHTQVNAKRFPERGDEVVMRIDRESSFDGVFHCVIEDKHFQGEGVIDANEIVRYRAYPDIHSFQDEHGLQLLLPVLVKSIDDNNRYVFEMSTLLNNAIDENFLYDEDETFMAVVTNYSEQKHTYACVSDYGLTFSLPRACTNEMLPNGTFIKAQIIERKHGIGLHLGRFMGYAEAGRTFTTPEAFNNLMVWYAGEGAVWTPTDTHTDTDHDEDTDMVDADETLEACYVEELMKITDRVAVVTSDYKQAYNYLGFTRLLALTLNDQAQADYYTKRMKLILLLKHFETNGRVDWNEMSEYEQMGDNVQNYQGLYTQYLQLQTVSYLSEASHNEDLWNLSLSASEPLLKQLSKLVLAYNLMGEFKLQQAQIQIHKKINALLNIQERQSSLMTFGEEDLHTEFKTSIVYPAGNSMREDIERQTWVILHVVCGFLNAEGGRLYLGVNNEGMGIGLQSDAASSMFKNKNFRDSYERYIIDNISWKMGNDMLLLIKTEWIDAKGRDVLCLHIQPSSKVVKLDGVCWCRFTSETRELKGETLRNFVASRQAVYATLTEKALAEKDNTTAVANTMPAITEDKKPQSAPTATTPAKHDTTKSLPPIHTSVLQLHGGAYAMAYINFLDEKTYMHCEDTYYGKARLTIPVYDGYENNYVVVVYTNGKMMRVPISHILEQNERQAYSLYVEPGVDIFFAALAKPTDLLLSMRIDHKKNRNATRCDSIDCLCEENSLNAKGEELLTQQSELIFCAIINQNLGKFKKITNMAKTTLGADISTKSFETLRRSIEAAGIVLP